MSKPNFAKLLRSAQMTISKHSPEILTGLGIAGMITTTVLAVRATPKALKLIEEKKEEQQVEKLKPTDAVKAVWKCYIPATVTGAVSVACLIGASSVSLRRNAALATAYKLSETALLEYKDKVIETIGEKKEQVIREKVGKERIEKNPVTKNEVIITDKGSTLCYDTLSSRYFKSDIQHIKSAIINLNERMINDMFGYVTLNDYFDELGLDHTTVGDDFGWNIQKGKIDIGFTSHIADDGTPCIVIDHYMPPNYGYSKF